MDDSQNLRSTSTVTVALTDTNKSTTAFPLGSTFTVELGLSPTPEAKEPPEIKVLKGSRTFPTKKNNWTRASKVLLAKMWSAREKSEDRLPSPLRAVLIATWHKVSPVFKLVLGQTAVNALRNTVGQPFSDAYIYDGLSAKFSEGNYKVTKIGWSALRPRDSSLYLRMPGTSATADEVLLWSDFLGWKDLPQPGTNTATLYVARFIGYVAKELADIDQRSKKASSTHLAPAFLLLEDTGRKSASPPRSDMTRAIASGAGFGRAADSPQPSTPVPGNSALPKPGGGKAGGADDSKLHQQEGKLSQRGSSPQSFGTGAAGSPSRALASSRPSAASNVATARTPIPSAPLATSATMVTGPVSKSPDSGQPRTSRGRSIHPRRRTQSPGVVAAQKRPAPHSSSSRSGSETRGTSARPPGPGEKPGRKPDPKKPKV